MNWLIHPCLTLPDCIISFEMTPSVRYLKNLIARKLWRILIPQEHFPYGKISGNLFKLLIDWLFDCFIKHRSWPTMRQWLVYMPSMLPRPKSNEIIIYPAVLDGLLWMVMMHDNLIVFPPKADDNSDVFIYSTRPECGTSFTMKPAHCYINLPMC